MDAVPPIIGKLHHLHAGVTGLLKELHQPLLFAAEILRHDLRIGKRCIDRMKQLHPRPRLPSADPRRFRICRNGPIAVKAPEVVDAHRVINL